MGGLGKPARATAATSARSGKEAPVLRRKGVEPTAADLRRSATKALADSSTGLAPDEPDGAVDRHSNLARRQSLARDKRVWLVKGPGRPE